MGDGRNSLTNSGTIDGEVLGGAGKDTVTNTGTIRGDDFLGDGDDVYTGGSGKDVVLDGGGSDTTDLGDGDDTYVASAQTASTEPTLSTAARVTIPTMRVPLAAT